MSKSQTLQTTGPTTETTAAPRTMLVLDTTAQPAEGNPTGERTHAQIVDGRTKQYKFQPGIALEMPEAEAFKFLKHEAFQLVDKDGNLVPFQRTPRQPEDLGAGERLLLPPDQTIARFDELSDKALVRRVLAIPGGERFGSGSEPPSRADLIEFIIAHKVKTRVANTSKEPDGDAELDANQFEDVA